jgi:enterochelin esterase family protein
MSDLLAVRVQPEPSLIPTRLDRLVFERGFPITAEDATTFAYRGDVDAVRLIHFGFGLPDDLSFERLGESDWWLLSLSLPPGTRLEYKLHITDGTHQYDTEDPLNPFEARNPFGQNSVCRSHGYTVPPWALRDPEAEEGLQRSLTIPSAHLSRAIHVNLYLPHDFSMEPEHRYPLLIMHDGSDYLHYADAATVLDNLIHRGLTPELVVAFCDPGDRLAEYANDERHARFVADELVPYLEGHLPLIGDRDSRCLGGASFGAIATLSTAARFPKTFGKLLLQSGSFSGASPDGLERAEPLWKPVTEFVSGFVANPIRVTDRAFMSCGLFEPLICENRALRPILANTDTTVLMAEARDGHTWGCWRDNLGLGLPWLFADSFRPRDVRPFQRPDPATAVGLDKMGSKDDA